MTNPHPASLVATEPAEILIRRFCSQAGPLFINQPRIVIAVSGGADSMALMYLLHASKLTKPTHLLIAHFDHALRPDSPSEAQFTRQSAQTLGLQWLGGTWSNPAQIGNLPALARQARYEFLLSAARQFDATHIATGHHKDDQAETFLERLLRGSGPQGLSAMAPTRPLTPEINLVRPLLFAHHQELTSWLTTQKLTWQEDPSNHNPHYLRSRIRHQLLPCLQTTVDNNVMDQLADTAWRMAKTNDALAWSLNQVWPELKVQISTNPRQISLSWQPLSHLPEELARRALLRCHQQLTNSSHPLGRRATTQFAHMMNLKQRHWSMTLMGMTIRREKERLFLIPNQQAPRKKRGECA